MYPYDNQFQNEFAKMLSSGIPQASKHVTKVNGRAGADSYQMPPNSDDILLDLNDPIIYFVQTDGAGYKTITPYDISPHKEVTEEDKFKNIENRLSKLEEAINNVKSNTRPNESRQHNDASNRGNAQG